MALVHHKQLVTALESSIQEQQKLFHPLHKERLRPLSYPRR
jgi:hypothetical protein